MRFFMIQDTYFPPKKHDLGWYLKRSRSVGCIRELKAIEDGTRAENKIAEATLERKETWKAKSFSGFLLWGKEYLRSPSSSCHRKKQFSFAINAYTKCIIYCTVFRFDFNPIHCLLQVCHKFIAVQLSVLTYSIKVYMHNLAWKDWGPFHVDKRKYMNQAYMHCHSSILGLEEVPPIAPVDQTLSCYLIFKLSLSRQMPVAWIMASLWGQRTLVKQGNSKLWQDYYSDIGKPEIIYLPTFLTLHDSAPLLYRYSGPWHPSPKNFWLDLQHNGYYACGMMYVPWFCFFCIGKNCRILGLG